MCLPSLSSKELQEVDYAVLHIDNDEKDFTLSSKSVCSSNEKQLLTYEVYLLACKGSYRQCTSAKQQQTQSLLTTSVI